MLAIRCVQLLQYCNSGDDPAADGGDDDDDDDDAAAYGNDDDDAAADGDDDDGIEWNGMELFIHGSFVKLYKYIKHINLFYSKTVLQE